ncbi:hypothetical protein SI90_05655 [Akkermansia muciniphila]|nr:hypothetical protein CXU05_07015 [Akkermansia muciniphila]QAA49113.1 hypothetical protein C1O40_11675 [Akkermansia muciniphila]QAA60690.1 hypothetical protein C1O57_11445 [Akkermansia muciniphila]QAR50073.1 hypothetical protein SI90_05655 [Akkermansia muciniphila]
MIPIFRRFQQNKPSPAFIADVPPPAGFLIRLRQFELPNRSKIRQIMAKEMGREKTSARKHY